MNSAQFTMIPCADRTIILLAARRRALREALLRWPNESETGTYKTGEVPHLAATLSVAMLSYLRLLPNKIMSRMDNMPAGDGGFAAVAALGNEVNAAQAGIGMAGFFIENVLLDEAAIDSYGYVSADICFSTLRLGVAMCDRDLTSAVRAFLDRTHPDVAGLPFQVLDDIATAPVIAVIRGEVQRPLADDPLMGKLMEPIRRLLGPDDIEEELGSLLESAPAWGETLPA